MIYIRISIFLVALMLSCIPQGIYAATIGYTTVGGTCSSASANVIRGNHVTAPANGTIDSIHYYGSETEAGTVNVKGVMVASTTKTILTNGISGASAAPATDQWNTLTYTTKPTITAGVEYIVMIIQSGVLTRLCRDTRTGANWYDTSNSYTTPTDPTDGIPSNVDYSMYATYSVTATDPQPTGNIFLFE